MKFGIIAAGKGSRLSNEGIHIPKPLIPISGTPMIKRLIDIFSNSGADKIIIIIYTLFSLLKIS
jgi:NDP-sugar pyrophosphorylase family protein